MELMFKEGDTHHAIKAKLFKNDGEDISLKDCRVYISVSDIVYEKECKIIDEDKGIIAYPASGLTKEPGWHYYEFIIKYSDGTQQIIPNRGYKKMHIYERIGE